MEFFVIVIAAQCTVTFKTYCASLSITSQLILFLRQNIEIDPLGHVRVGEALKNFVQKCDPVLLSEVHKPWS